MTVNFEGEGTEGLTEVEQPCFGCSLVGGRTSKMEQRFSHSVQRVELPFTLSFSTFCHFCYRLWKELCLFSSSWRNERSLVREVAYLLAFFFISFLLLAENKAFTNFLRNFLKNCRENNTWGIWKNVETTNYYCSLPSPASGYVCLSVTLLLPSPALTGKVLLFTTVLFCLYEPDEECRQKWGLS